MHTLRLLVIVFCTVLGTTSAAGASETAQLPGTTGGPSPLLAAGALIAAAALRRQLRAAQGSMVTAKVAGPDHRSDLVLPVESTEERGIASWADLVVRLNAAPEGGRLSTPLLVVRLDGVEETRRRYGDTIVEHMVVAAAHRIRAALRRDDLVVGVLPQNLFILVGDDPPDEGISVVRRRLETVLDTPITSMKRRHTRFLTTTVQVVRATVVDRRLQIDMADGRLVDVPLATRSCEPMSPRRAHR